MFAQLGETRDSVRRLAMAHVDLAKAEISAIGGQIARAAALVGIAVALVLLIGILLVVGLSLFTAEWLLGSMGWGILHGVLLFAGIATAAVLAAIGMSAGRIGRSFLAALLIGVLVAIVLALDLTNQAYAQVGTSVLPGIEAGVRPLVSGILVVAVIGLLAGLVLASRVPSARDRIAAVFGAVVVGALVGAFTAITFGTQPGIGLGAAVGYAAWIVLMGADMARTGVDLDALKARFYPTLTIDTSKETLEWLQSKMPRGIGS